MKVPLQHYRILLVIFFYINLLYFFLKNNVLNLFNSCIYLFIFFISSLLYSIFMSNLLIYNKRLKNI